jgi:hypothetical protein
MCDPVKDGLDSYCLKEWNRSRSATDPSGSVGISLQAPIPAGSEAAVFRGGVREHVQVQIACTLRCQGRLSGLGKEDIPKEVNHV